MCVDRTELTLRSPEDHTDCGSSLGWNVNVLITSAGPPSVRYFTSECRCAISTDWVNASAILAANLLQLIETPRGETASVLQTTSSFGPIALKDQRSWTMSAKPSVWSLCMCVKNTASSCSGPMPSCDNRIVVPRPASNCSFTAAHPLASSP